jgi:hypothetical protein
MSEVKNRPIALQKLNETIQMIEKSIALWAVERPWLDKAASFLIRKAYNESLRFLRENVTWQAKRADWEEPILTVKEIEDKNAWLIRTHKLVENREMPSLTPTPVPTPEITPPPTPTPKPPRPPFAPIDVTGFENNEL